MIAEVLATGHDVLVLDEPDAATVVEPDSPAWGRAVTRLRQDYWGILRGATIMKVVYLVADRGLVVAMALVTAQTVRDALAGTLSSMTVVLAALTVLANITVGPLLFSG